MGIVQGKNTVVSIEIDIDLQECIKIKDLDFEKRIAKLTLTK
jgi:hypothetical protein